MTDWRRSLAAIARLWTVVVLNEVYPNPLTNEEEWIELFNSGNEVVDLGGYYLDDKEDGGTSPYKIPDGERIEPGNFRVFEKSVTGIGLNNEGDVVRLLDPQELTVDAVVYNALPQGKSYQRKIDGEGEWQIGEATKNQPNYSEPETSPNPTVNLTGLKISEVYACPINETESEWVEFSNTAPVLLETEVKLMDGSNREKRFKLKILPGGWESIDLANGWLNNGGDEVRLYDALDRLIGQMSYDECRKKSSWSLIGDQFRLTTMVTRNAAYVWATPTEPSVTLSPTPQTATLSPTNIPTISPTITEEVDKMIEERETVLGTMSADRIYPVASQEAEIDDSSLKMGSVSGQSGRYWLMAGFLLLTGGFWGDIMKRKDA